MFGKTRGMRFQKGTFGRDIQVSKQNFSAKKLGTYCDKTEHNVLGRREYGAGYTKILLILWIALLDRLDYG